MQRKYYSRGKERTVERLEGVIAVLPDEAVRGPEAVVALAEPAERGRLFGVPIEEADIELSIQQEDRRALEAAGWTFVAPKETVALAADRGQEVAGAAVVQYVYRDEHGRALIGTDRMIVKLESDISETSALEVLSSRGLEVIKALRFGSNLFQVRVRAGSDTLDLSIQLHDDERFVYAEPEFVEHIPQRWTPSDPEYRRQWHLNNTGQDGGTPGADIKAEAAWNLTRGNSTFRLAVIDNGFDVTHSDLASGIVGPAYFQDMGIEVVLMQGTNGFPDSNHGTFCAGLAAARADNGLGGCGVACDVMLMPIACLTDQVGTQSTLARAIAYASDPSTEVEGADPAYGAAVISCSLGPNDAVWEMNGVLQDSIDFAVTHGRGGLGTPIFWAVTNGEFEIRFDEVCAYPSTIAVSRSTRDDVHDNAGYGPELDFVATGVGVYSTQSGGRYGTSTGTSFAAPTAAGVAALVLSVDPNLQWEDLRELLRLTCDKIGRQQYDANGRNDRYGFGRVNADRAVRAAASGLTAGHAI